MGGATGATMKNNKPRHILDWSVIILTFQTSNFEEMATLCDEGRLGKHRKNWDPMVSTQAPFGGSWVDAQKTWSKMVKNHVQSIDICLFCLADLILARMYYVLTVWQQVSSQYSWKELPSSDSRNATQSTQSAYSNCSQLDLTKNAKKASTIIKVPWK